jgi:hypothetical protein
LRVPTASRSSSASNSSVIFIGILPASDFRCTAQQGELDLKTYLVHVGKFPESIQSTGSVRTWKRPRMVEPPDARLTAFSGQASARSVLSKIGLSAALSAKSPARGPIWDCLWKTFRSFLLVFPCRSFV